MQDTIYLFFGYNASKDALSQVVQTEGYDVTSEQSVATRVIKCGCRKIGE